MIQRIQSLLLLLAAICLIIAVFMPIATITTDNAQYLFTSWSLQLNIENGDVIFPTYYIGVMQIILAALSFITIFFYKNRATQSKMCIAGIVINFILLILILYVYPDNLFGKLYLLKDSQLVYSLWTILSIASLGLLFLANKFIKKDEKKVREADRLR